MDAKGQVMTAVVAILALKDLHYDPPGKVMVQSVVGEEPDGNGTLSLCAQGVVADAAINLEATDNHIAYGHRGIVGLRYRLAGEVRHGSVRGDQANAIVQVGALAAALDASLDDWRHPSDAVYGPPTINVGRVAGGDDIFSTPFGCTLECGIRYAPETYEAILSHVSQKLQSQIVREIPDLSTVEEAVFFHADAAGISPRHPFAQAFHAAVNEIEGDRELVTFPAGCDVRHFINRYRLPAVIFGPGETSVGTWRKRIPQPGTVGAIEPDSGTLCDALVQLKQWTKDAQTFSQQTAWLGGFFPCPSRTITDHNRGRQKMRRQNLRCSTAVRRSRWAVVWLLLASFWPAGWGHADEQPAELEPKPRFFYNDDGDRAVFLLKGPFHERQLQYAVDVLVGTGVTTLIYCANFGSDQAYYPSKVASALGWREVEQTRRNARYTYFNRVHEVGGLLRERKIDVLGAVMRRAKQQGLEFVPSLRMNDTHFLNKDPPLVHPLTGEFWMQNRDLTIDGGALDFTHQKVRDYRMGQINELIDSYAADGFEMDFSRQPIIFPKGSGQRKQNLVTEMVRKARQRLDQKGEKDGKRRFLIVRVPHLLARCQDYGFDLGAWMKEGLVDYVVPASPDRYFQFDIPLAEFLVLAERTDSKCRVVAGPDSYKATPAMYRAAIANYYTLGQQDHVPVQLLHGTR